MIQNWWVFRWKPLVPPAMLPNARAIGNSCPMDVLWVPLKEDPLQLGMFRRLIELKLLFFAGLEALQRWFPYRGLPSHKMTHYHHLTGLFSYLMLSLVSSIVWLEGTCCLTRSLHGTAMMAVFVIRSGIAAMMPTSEAAPCNS